MAVEITTLADVKNWDGTSSYYIPIKTKQSERDPTPTVTDAEVVRVERLQEAMNERIRSQTNDKGPDNKQDRNTGNTARTEKNK